MTRNKRIGIAFIAIAVALMALAFWANEAFYYAGFIFMITGLMIVARRG